MLIIIRNIFGHWRLQSTVSVSQSYLTSISFESHCTIVQQYLESIFIANQSLEMICQFVSNADIQFDISVVYLVFLRHALNFDVFEIVC